MSEEKKKVIDYKDPDTLKTFISENGKIMSSRYTRLTAKEQRKPKKVTGKEKYTREPRLQAVDDGGESYWSNKLHTWIKGDVKNKIYTSPQPNQ